jgi:RNA polymerase sigma factor (sigma-70 family)
MYGGTPLSHPSTPAPDWPSLFAVIERSPTDQHAWAALYVALWPYLADWIISRYGFDPSSASDVLQDALLDYQRKLNAKLIERPSLAHVRGFVRLSVLNALKARSRFVPLEEVEATAVNSEHDSLQMLVDSEQEMLRRLVVDRALDQLDERCGFALRLRYYEGLSSAEIGRALNLSTAHVDVLLHRCRGRLRELLTMPHQQRR